MGTISLQIPQVGQSDLTEDPKVASNFTALQTWANGNIDTTNISPTAGITAAQTTGIIPSRGFSNIATSESRTNVAYGTLPTPDQVTGIVLPANGLIAVWYQATWQESVWKAANAAIFLGANQLQSAVDGAGSPLPQFASMALTASSTAVNRPLFTSQIGLTSGYSTATYTGNVTTGQVIGAGGLTAGGTAALGGPVYIFAAAGTYTVSVQFNAGSGSVTASNRVLRVQAVSFG